MEETARLENSLKNTNLKCPSDNVESTNKNPEFTILAKIYSDKQQNHNAFKSTILKAWNPKKKILINPIPPFSLNLFSCLFDLEEDMEKVLNLSWSFKDQMIIIKRWPPDKALFEIDLTTANFWCQVAHLPVSFINLHNAKIIRDKIGRFLKMEDARPGAKWRRATRIWVEVDITAPLPDHLTFISSEGKELMVEIRFERLGDFCFNCSILGHRYTSCTEKLSSPSSPRRRGLWIMAENLLAENPNFSLSRSPKAHKAQPNLDTPRLIPSFSPPSMPVNSQPTNPQLLNPSPITDPNSSPIIIPSLDLNPTQNLLAQINLNQDPAHSPHLVNEAKPISPLSNLLSPLSQTSPDPTRTQPTPMISDPPATKPIPTNQSLSSTVSSPPSAVLYQPLNSAFKRRCDAETMEIELETDSDFKISKLRKTLIGQKPKSLSCLPSEPLSINIKELEAEVDFTHGDPSIKEGSHE